MSPCQLHLDSAATAHRTDEPASCRRLRFTFESCARPGAFGQGRLSTTPTPNGLRVDKFQARARNLSLDAAGEWVRAGSGTRSSFKLDFNARSLGQMLDALGYADMVEDGPTKATLAGSWPGPPGAFGLATLGGTLKAEWVKDACSMSSQAAPGACSDYQPGGNSASPVARFQRLLQEGSPHSARGISGSTKARRIRTTCG